MLHDDVFKQYKKHFPREFKETSTWFPNGRNSVRVRLVSRPDDYIFTYHNAREFVFEPVEIFIKRLKKGGGTMNVRLHDSQCKN